MAVTIASSSQNNSTTGTALDVDKPSGTVDGDLMVAFITTMETGATWTPPSGWTLIKSDAYVESYYRVASSEGTTYRWTSSTSAQMIGVIMRITGGTTIGASSNQSNGASTTATGTTITPAAADSLLLFLVYFRSTTAGANASGYAIVTSNPTWTELLDIEGNSSRPHVAIASANRPETTATGNATATLSVSVTNIVHMVAVSPTVVSAAHNLTLTGAGI